MTSIEERLRHLEDQQSILDAMYGYGHALDAGHEDAWIDCFAQDAILDWPGRSVMHGHAELRAGFRLHTHAPAVFHKHIVVDPRVTINGDTATVHSLFARLDRYPDGPQIRAFGRYRDVLVRCADGRWRLTERYPDIEGVRMQAPIDVEPFPDSPMARNASGQGSRETPA